MSFLRASGVALACVLTLTGCVTPSAEDIRERFVDAGGTCSSWTSLSDGRAVNALECDSGARVYLFDGDTARTDFVKTELESNIDIRNRTHIMLSGENWLIIDRIGVIVRVMPSLHGIIQGRNGANP